MRWIIFACALLLCGPAHAQMLKTIVGGNSSVPAPPSACNNTSVGGPWTCLKSTILNNATSTPRGGTAGPIDCTTANLITIEIIGLGTSLGFINATTDSSSNTYTIGADAGSGAGGHIAYVISPTVTSSMTFTVTSSTDVFINFVVQCWHDASGTPSFDSPQFSTNSLGSPATSIQTAVSGTTPANNNSLNIVGVAYDTANTDPLATIDGSFVFTNQSAAINGSSYAASGGYKFQATAGFFTATATFGGVSAASSSIFTYTFAP